MSAFLPAKGQGMPIAPDHPLHRLGVAPAHGVGDHQDRHRNPLLLGLESSRKRCSAR